LLQRLGPGWQTEPLEARLHALADALTDLGFAASVEPAPTGAQLCQHHCPVSHVAERFPQLCEAETAAFAELLGHHVQRLATLAQGAGVCTTVIPDPAAVPDSAEHVARQQHLPPVDERTSA
jgi:predicted ArsR family transcriptional regulator